MASRESQWVAAIQEALGNDVAAVALFGSQARGDAFDDSDTDLAVFLRPGIEVGRHHYRRLAVPALLAPDLSIVIIGTTDVSPSGFLLELARGHRVLWEQEAGFLHRLLTDLERRAVESGARRYTTPSGDPYWVGV